MRDSTFKAQIGTDPTEFRLGETPNGQSSSLPVISLAVARRRRVPGPPRQAGPLSHPRKHGRTSGCRRAARQETMADEFLTRLVSALLQRNRNHLPDAKVWIEQWSTASVQREYRPVLLRTPELSDRFSSKAPGFVSIMHSRRATTSPTPRRTRLSASVADALDILDAWFARHVTGTLAQTGHDPFIARELYGAS